MGKLIVIVSVVASTTMALIIYFSYRNANEDPSARELDREPRIVLDDFSVFRYEGKEIDSTFSAKFAHFLEPNLVEIFAAINGMRYLPDRIETLRCESAQAEFNVENMGQLMRATESKLSRAEVEDQVRIGVGDYLLKSEHARYTAANNMLFSGEPVEVEGPKRSFVGEEGFRYHLKDENLEVMGKVHGIMSPEDKFDDAKL